MISHVRWAVVVVLTLVLSGCYLPTRFLAEINIQRNGDYTLTYDGVVWSSNLVPGLITGDPTPEEIAQRIEGVHLDLGRDSSFREIEYLSDGAFQVYFEKSDNIFERRGVTFIRTDSRFFTMSYVRETGQITVRGSVIPSNQRETLAAVGYAMTGELRVTTDARVIEHNADGVVSAEDGGGLTYIWVIRGVDVIAPLLIIG